jgi:signal transduction histidine kinase
MVCDKLRSARLDCELCADVDSLLSSLAGAGAAVIAAEALNQTGADALLGALDAQEPWSDIPILLLTTPPSKRLPHSDAAVVLLERANVTLLERPLRIHLFLSAVRSAVRARQRQYQTRELLRDLKRAVWLGEMFSSILAHDLRTPLGAIKMLAEVIVRTSRDPHALRRAGHILSSADRMARMIAQLLDFARVRQGRGIALKLEAANIQQISRPIVQELEASNPEAAIEITPMGDLSGKWDHDRLAQVMSNLGENAVRHGRNGAPISIELDGTDRTSVRLRFRNFGRIAAEALPTLFEPFKQAAPATTAPKGLGLGLFIALEIVRAHGGDIAVDVGDELTTFEVTLPREAHAVETATLAAT